MELVPTAALAMVPGPGLQTSSFRLTPLPLVRADPATLWEHHLFMPLQPSFLFRAAHPFGRLLTGSISGGHDPLREVAPFIMHGIAEVIVARPPDIEPLGVTGSQHRQGR